MRDASIRFFVCVLVAGFVLSSPAAAQLTDGEKTAILLDRYTVVANQTYTTQSGTDLKLDVYLPPLPPGTAPNAPRALTPVVVEIHGGGWVAGTKEGSQLLILPYLQMGFAAVNVEYRMAKTALAPASVEDCRCALRWVLRNAKRFGFDTGKVVITGGSAGGHLALTTGMLPASAGLDRECAVGGMTAAGWEDAGEQGEMKVAAIVNWFGITDVPAMLEGPESRGYAVQWFGSLPNREEIARRVSPLTYAKAGVPPVITIHGDKDTLVPHAQAERLHAALQKAGVANKLVTVPGGGHGGFTADQDVMAFTAIKEFLIQQKVIAGPGSR
jgi:acetyl esterase/lipase